MSASHLLALALLVAACGCVVLALVARRRALAGRAGSFRLSVRSGLRASGGETPFVPGTAHYQGGVLEFYRTLAFSTHPTFTWQRVGLEIVGRSASPGGLLLVKCRYRGEPVEFLLTEAAYTGLASWLEAAPPGTPSSLPIAG